MHFLGMYMMKLRTGSFLETFTRMINYDSLRYIEDTIMEI